MPNIVSAKLRCSELLSAGKDQMYISDMVDLAYERLVQGTEVSKAIEFKSLLSGEKIVYEVDVLLGKSSSEVFLTKDKKHVVKVYPYDPSFLIQMHEILISRFLVSKGLSVSEVVDYSENALIPDGKPMYVVKKFQKGLDFQQRREFELNPARPKSLVFTSAPSVEAAKPKTLGGVLEVDRRRLVEEYDQVLKDSFYEWLLEQEFGVEYIKAFSVQQGKGYGDTNRKSNWLLTKEGWTLIDP